MENKINDIAKLVSENGNIINVDDCDIFLPNGEDDGEYFQVLTIYIDNGMLFCNMDCDNDEVWAFADLTDNDIDIIHDELF